MSHIGPPDTLMPRQESQPRTYERIGIQIPTIYLPRPGVDMTRWAVVACDQHTSEPEYWDTVEKIVGDSPSTLRLILPEIYLGKPGEEERIRQIHKTMRNALDQGLLEPHTGMMYVERTIDQRTRRGLMLCLDLEQYDFTKASTSLIRATEGTIIERLPPRIKIREGALLELPHILVLIDDPQRTVIEPLSLVKTHLVKRYDFDLMLDSGHLTGYQIEDPALEAQVIQALEKLADPQAFAAKYSLDGQPPVLLFAMGDGNHSLATAKAIWEMIKPIVGLDHPARYALVEVENVHDTALEFEPIHRVIFDVMVDFESALTDYFGENATFRPIPDKAQMFELLENPVAGCQAVGVVMGGQCGLLELERPTSNLAVGSLQPFLDTLLKNGQAQGIDYVHGEEVVFKLAIQPGNIGFFLPHMRKSDLFKTVILDGVLPRKTFSMGEPREKRFYVEARKIA